MNPEDYLKYEPETGKLYWLSCSPELSSSSGSASRFNARFAGKEAFTQKLQSGYRVGKILGKSYYAHVVIWRLVTGEWPVGEVDHINRDSADNRLENLREATTSENRANRSVYKNNLVGFKGVSFCGDTKKFRARVRQKHIGVFDTALEAALAYDKVAKEVHGDFAFLNFNEVAVGKTSV